ncbi:MAG: ABC transporter permease [Verrucomicrobia bacterium]|nr:ABC transporter permease [Verrucomicrobiota bacterium]MBI3867764.1 ABC transporter permease [Verrucomicrobiota bacterium]
MKRLWVSTLFFACLIAVWEILIRKGVWDSPLLPSPTDIAVYLTRGMRSGELIDASWVTSKRLFLGYFVSLVVGLPLGLLNARFRFVQDTLGVVALGLQTLPSVCWAPVALITFGQNEVSMFFIVLMGSLFSIMLATSAGVQSVPPIYSRAARTMGSRGFHTWYAVMLPASLPFVVSGMKQGWAFAWRSLMGAEIYVIVQKTGAGLGLLLHYGREVHDIAAVAGIMVVIVVIGLVADKIMFSPFERFMHKRWGTSKE